VAQAKIPRFIVEMDELTATKQLLDHADELLGEVRFLDRDSHTVTAVLASGAEKMLKLTYGLLITHLEGTWPGKAIKGYSHRIGDLDIECRRVLLTREAMATNPGVVLEAREALDSDPWLPGILEIVHRYADAGRFFNLDFLNGVEHREPSPRELWQQLDYETWEASGALVPSSPRDDETFEVNERRRAEAWQTSLRRWREFYYQCWVQNMCGPDARRYAFEIRGPSAC
jgi:hypothetical protein